MARRRSVTSLVRVTVEAAAAELAADALWAARASAVHEERLPDGRVRLTADADAPARLDPGWTVERVDVDSDAYRDAWRTWARAVRVGSVVLQPPWVEPVATDAGDVVVVLDPGRAFGSGSHPSTQLVVAELQALVHPGDRLLDVGCGSGVLAVAAVLLGAAAATAIDVVPEAVDATIETARVNGVLEHVDASVTPIAGVGAGFDLVVANIGASILIELAPEIAARVGPEGRAVLSGFLEPQADAVAAAHAPLREIRRRRDGDWSVIVLAR